MGTTAAAQIKQIGDYEIEDELGRGAFGIVYHAHHRARPEIPLALKVVQGRGNMDRLLLEPAVLSRLEHPNIVGLEDYFVHGDDLVLALEFIDGRDLKSMLEDGATFSQAEVRDLLVQLGSALKAAHAQNVVHRDIKPANILVQPQGDGWRFVLTDFGIGQVQEGIQTRKHTGGTYLFMAPEQLRGRPGPQSDLWALGVVAYRLLTGRMPFAGPTIRDLTNQILYGGVPPLSATCKEPIDSDLDKAILHLLDKSLQERTASAEELLRELGHRGKAETVPRHGKQKVGPGAGRSLDEKLAEGIRLRRLLLVLCVLCYLLPTAVGASLLLLAGMTVFYLAQRHGGWSRPRVVLWTVLACALLAGHTALRWFPTTLDVNPLASVAQLDLARRWRAVEGMIPPVLSIPLLIVGVILLATVYLVWLFLPVIAGSLFAGLRRLEREKLLRDLALQGEAGSDEYLEALRQAVDTRFEDVGLHLKYAEALYARGQVKEAAAELRLLVRQDPYHFSGNLLLANAYRALGLDALCAEVCEGYLAVSGYCFEFAELLEGLRRGVAR
jgi:hypothetical protein